MDLKQLFDRNYNAVFNRGLITQNTKDSDFYKKAKEELIEVFHEIMKPKSMINHDKVNEEIADLLNVCSNWLKFRGADLESELTKIAEKNEQRAI